MDTMPIELPGPMLERLGLAVVRWGLIERQLGDLAARLLRADRGPFFVVTADAPADSQVRWIRFLVEGSFPDPKDRDSILNLVSAIEALGHRVRDLAGGVWFAGPTAAESYVESVRFGRPQPLQHVPVRIADLDDLTHALANASKELATLLQTLRHRSGETSIAPDPGPRGGSKDPLGRSAPFRAGRRRGR